jgi:hypothetical protein
MKFGIIFVEDEKKMPEVRQAIQKGLQESEVVLMSGDFRLINFDGTKFEEVKLGR